VRWLLASALLIASLGVSTTSLLQAAGQGASFAPEGFATELERLDSALDSATVEDAGRLRTGLPDRWHVESGTERYEISTDWLARALSSQPGTRRDWPARLAGIRARLRTMRSEALARDARSAERPVAAARRVLDDVLQRREFQQQVPAAWRRAIEEKLREWFDALGDRLDLSPRDGRRVAVILAWLAGVAALGALALLVVRLLTRRGRSVRLSIGRVAVHRTSAADWAQRSIAAAQRSDLREAVRCAYNACVLKLEEEGVWRADPARTTREYLRLVPQAHARRQILTEVTAQFERAWYGNQPPTIDSVERVTRHLESLGCLAAREPRAI
jgi:hypothetical protein